MTLYLCFAIGLALTVSGQFPWSFAFPVLSEFSVQLPKKLPGGSLSVSAEMRNPEERPWPQYMDTSTLMQPSLTLHTITASIALVQEWEVSGGLELEITILFHTNKKVLTIQEQ